MKAGVTTTTNIWSGDYRLDGSYHTSEGIKTARSLGKWSSSARNLDTLDSLATIFNGPRFPRNYVEDPNRGIPFLSSSDMLLTDLSGIKHLSKKHTPATLLNDIKIEQGWTLISCSGTIGNTVYVRQDMAHMTGSQHIMRAVPKKDKVLSGYLYAFLSSDIAYSLITQGTYGAVIRHIEPKHIEKLPIPRLNPAKEEQIHQLIEQAAQLRVEANQLFKQAQNNFLVSIFGNTSNNSAYFSSNRKRITLGLTNSAEVYSNDYRLDAGLYANTGSKIQQFLHFWRASDPQNNKLDYLGNVCIKNGIFIGGRAKRVYVNDPSHGIPFLSSSDMLIASFRHVNLISKKQPGLKKLLLQQGWTLISRSGTIGNVAYVRRDMDGLAGSEHIMRVVPDTKKIQSGYLFAFLNSSIGVSLIRQGTFGSVVDTIAPDFIATILIPRIDPVHENNIHNLVEEASENQAKANEFENQAQSLLQASLGLPS